MIQHLVTAVVATEGGGGFEGPTLDEFFPGGLLFKGTPFELSRINLIGLAMTGLLCLFFITALKKPKIVPGRQQSLAEMAIDLVKVQVIDEVIGPKGAKYLPYLSTLFFMVLSWNLASIIPGMNIPATSVIGVPFMLAVTTYFVFNREGFKAHGVGAYFKANLFPPGVPKPIYVLLTPIELVSTFMLRPLTLTIRLWANMMAGHLMLVLFFSSAWYLLFESTVLMKPFGLVSFGAGFAFTLFEIMVGAIQAYIFTLLTAVYISGAISEHH